MDQPAGLSDSTAVLATMHGKERVIGPVLLAELGLQVKVPPEFDSDAFGTFTREVARAGSQIEAARLKLNAALDLTGAAVGLASEGAFGPHPEIPWVACDRELVLLRDRGSGLEVVGEAVSSDTNYRQQSVTSVAAAVEFAQQVGFPEHALVVMSPGEAAKAARYKGITEPQQLSAAVEAVLAAAPSAWLETDMRALYNPTRMRLIEQAARSLAQTFHQRCPACGWPGFSVRQKLPGLPCSLCGMPTLLIQSQRYRCQHCGYQQLRPVDGPASADPTYCPYCNP